MTAYCPHHDPLIQAGSIHCGQCDLRGYPTDAEWVDETKLLVTYEALCAHRAGEVWLVDVTRFERAPRSIPGPRRCAAPTRTGTLCRAYVRPGSDRCRWHVGARR